MLLFLFVLRILFLPFFQGPSLPVHHKEMDRKPDVEQSDYYKPNPSCGILATTTASISMNAQSRRFDFLNILITVR